MDIFYLFLYNFSTVDTIFLSVVIPSYNEIFNLRKGVLDKVKRFLDNKKFHYEVIIVDDGSTDGSYEFVKDFVKNAKTFSVLKNHHTGKAGTVAKGMLSSKGKFVLFTDMDQATPIEEIDTLLQFTKNGEYQIAIGSRTIGGLRYPLSRLVLHEAGILLRKLIVGLPEVFDTQCGFKLFTHESSQITFNQLTKIHSGFKEISNSAVQFGFDVEILLIAKNKGYKIKEVPVHWMYVESRRVSPLRDSIEGIINLFSIKIKSLQGKYK